MVSIPVIAHYLYFSFYGRVLNNDALLAIYQTNFSETMGFIQQFVGIKVFISLIVILLVSLILSICLYKYINKLELIERKRIKCTFCFLFTIGAIYVCFVNIITGPFVDFYNTQKNYQYLYQNQKILEEQLKSQIEQGNVDDSGIYVLVIGESHNKLYTSAYGYKIDTTPWLREMKDNPNFILFNDAYSGFPNTFRALSYALTLKNQYNNYKMEDVPSIVSIANAAGYNTVWISNQGRYDGISLFSLNATQSIWTNSSANRLSSQKTLNVVDGNIIPKLSDIKYGKKTLVIIHLYGSHGKYNVRYPENYPEYHGVRDTLTEQYITSVRYNDDVMKAIYQHFSSMKDFKALVYFSDHGESVKYNKGHTFDEATYDQNMILIPMYMYFSNSYIKEYPKEFQALKKAHDDTFTNDLITNTMLSIMHIKIKGMYEPQNDLASPQYDNNYDRFRTGYGKYKLDFHATTDELE